MIASIAFLLALAGAPQAAAQHAPPAASLQEAHAGNAAEAAQVESEKAGVDFMHHIQDSQEIETPFGAIHLPHKGSWMVGPIDMTPSKHVVFMGLAALLVIALVSMGASLASRAERGRTAGKRHNAIEAFILFLRNEVVLKNIDHGEKFVPFILTLFFFILFCNLLGMLPWGATATSNISVTAALALVTFVVIEVAGMFALGPAYLSTIFYWNKDLALPIRVLMFLIMSPVEAVGKITKPVSLAIRLMANMTAGHIVLLAIVSLIFVFGSFAIAVAPVLMAVAINFLELFVSFLQAYIFALLASVFIGVIRHAHH
jgi:F-type H+-transporting ATPase subunit a